MFAMDRGCRILATILPALIERQAGVMPVVQAVLPGALR